MRTDQTVGDRDRAEQVDMWPWEQAHADDLAFPADHTTAAKAWRAGGEINHQARVAEQHGAELRSEIPRRRK